MLLFRTVLAALAILPGIASPVPETPKDGDTIPGAYIVVLKKDVSAQAIEEHKTWTTSIHSEALKKRGEALPVKTFTYEYDMETVKGYAGIFDKSTIDEIAARDEVAFVEPDAAVTTAGLTTRSPIASYGLGSISHHSGKGSNYIFDAPAGHGVYVYVLDTGIFLEHSDFGGRATWGVNLVDKSNTDKHGQGTHVAGTIGSTTYGVAKNVNLIAVKVLGDNAVGSISSIVAGVDWVVNDVKAKGRKTKSVANMGFSSELSVALNQAVEYAVDAGITVAVAAGNGGVDASGSSPASVITALTVGAIGSNLARASYSNFGAELDIFAPGSDIISTSIADPKAFATWSGTSMASAHVAGVAAYLIAKENLESSDDVRDRIRRLATNGLVKDPGPNSPNKLLYNGSGK